MDWNETVENLGPRLFRFFAIRTSEETASDLVQDTLLKLFELVEKGRFDPKKGSIGAFSYGIAVNIQREHIRRGKKWRFDPLEAECIAATSAEERDEVFLLRNAVNKLTEPQLSIIQMYIDQELSLSEISSVMDMPVGTIKSHIHRAKTTLKSKISKMEKEL